MSMEKCKTCIIRVEDQYCRACADRLEAENKKAYMDGSSNQFAADQKRFREYEVALKEKDEHHIACYHCPEQMNDCDKCEHRPDEEEPGRAKAGQGDTVKVDEDHEPDGRNPMVCSSHTGTPSAPETPAPLMICDKVDEHCHCWHGTPHVWMGGIYGGCNLSCYKGRDRSMCVPVKAPSKEGTK